MWGGAPQCWAALGTVCGPSGRGHVQRAPEPHSSDASPQNPRGGGDRGLQQTGVAGGSGEEARCLQHREKMAANLPIDNKTRTSLAIQRFRIHLLGRGHRASSLVLEDPQSSKAHHHSYWAWALEPGGTATEAHMPESRVLNKGGQCNKKPTTNAKRSHKGINSFSFFKKSDEILISESNK